MYGGGNPYGMFRPQPTATDAIGQILGAVMQRNQQNKEQRAFTDALNYQQQIGSDQLANQTTQRIVPQQDQQYQGLLGSTAFDQNAPTAQPAPTSADIGTGLGLGLIGKAMQPSLAQQEPSAPTSADIGTNLPSSQDKNVSLINPTNMPATTTTTTPMSLQEAQTHIGNASNQALLELSKKYGMSAMREIAPLVMQAGQQRLGQFQQQQTQTQTSNLMNQFNTETNPNKRAMIAAQLNNYGMKLDPKMITALQPDYKLNTVNQGNQTALVFHNPKTGEIINAGALPTGMTQFQSQEVAMRGAGTWQPRPIGGGGGGGGRVSGGSTKQPQTTKIQGKSGQTYTPQQIQQAQDDASEYYTRQDDKTIQFADDKDWARYKKAAFIVNDQQGQPQQQEDQTEE